MGGRRTCGSMWTRCGVGEGGRYGKRLAEGGAVVVGARGGWRLNALSALGGWRGGWGRSRGRGRGAAAPGEQFQVRTPVETGVPRGGHVSLHPHLSLSLRLLPTMALPFFLLFVLSWSCPCPSTLAAACAQLSSAHVYLRLPDGTDIASIPAGVLEDCAQLVKHNSIEGNRTNGVVVVYTPWANLKKSGDMATGQVGFHSPKVVRRTRVEKRDNAIVNRLNKTRSEAFPDLAAEKEAHLRAVARAAREVRFFEWWGEATERRGGGWVDGGRKVACGRLSLLRGGVLAGSVCCHSSGLSGQLVVAPSCGVEVRMVPAGGACCRAGSSTVGTARPVCRCTAS